MLVRLIMCNLWMGLCGIITLELIKSSMLFLIHLTLELFNW
ncbi:hypothetical protein RDABS01_027599 [Bienertia sinuspersici]